MLLIKYWVFMYSAPGLTRVSLVCKYRWYKPTNLSVTLDIETQAPLSLPQGTYLIESDQGKKTIKKNSTYAIWRTYPPTLRPCYNFSGPSPYYRPPLPSARRMIHPYFSLCCSISYLVHFSMMTSGRERNEFVAFAVAFYLAVSAGFPFSRPKIFMNLLELSPERNPEKAHIPWYKP